MAALHRIECPHCGAVLKSSKGIKVGKQLQCLKCQAPFTVSHADGAAAESAPESDLDLVLSEGQLAESASPPRLGLLDQHVAATEQPRLGVLEPTRVSAAPRENDRPLPQPVAIAITHAPALPPARRNWMSVVLACGALLLFLAAGGFLAVVCFSETPADDDLAPIARNARESPAGDSAKVEPKRESPPSRTERTKEPASPETTPPAKVAKKEPPVVRRTPRDVLPASPFGKITKTAKAHPEQKRIDEAIERGIAYLRTQRQESGSWGNGLHGVGYAALPALTLLECGVKADDLAVQRAARFVRDHSPTLEETYDLSLAILFLDRLGESRDRDLIQKLALRLVAGQTALGGWGYKCPVLTAEQSRDLLAALHKMRPPTPLLNPLEKGGTPSKPLPAGSLPLPGSAKPPNAPHLAPPIAQAGVRPKLSADHPTTSSGAEAMRAEFLPEFVRKLPIHPRSSRADNSNSQFALLALWAARRHEVPTEMTLALAEERYRVFQNPDGGWGYHIRGGGSPAMTCVGLLGLGVGHGTSELGLRAAATQRDKLPPGLAKEDAAIKKALRALGTHIGTPNTSPFIPPMTNLYFLWSLERVAMLYSLETIGGKDWYGWGISILLPNQQANGAWFSTQYPGQNPTIDTCFALLFLRRSNLVQDLTENLQLYLAITDPDARK